MRGLSCIVLSFILISCVAITAAPNLNLQFQETPIGGAVLADVTELWTYSTGENNGIDSGVTLADVDLDGRLEVIAGTWGNDRIHVVNAEDGSHLWNTSIADQIRCTPAVGDIDGDTKPEIVFSSWDGNTYALNGEDGSQLWNTTTGGMVENGVCLGDVNNDTRLDVLIANTGGTVYGLNGLNGSIIWSTTLAKGVHGTPAIGDIDQDGELELVVCTDDFPSYIYSLNALNGSVEWSITGNRAFRGHPVLADLDGDGQVEVIATTSYMSSIQWVGFLFVVNGTDGSEIWTRSVGANPYGSPSVGDVDGDGRFEIVVGIVLNSGTYLKVFDHEGNQQFSLNVHPFRSAYVFTPILADLNGNERLDILLVAHPGGTAWFWGVDGRSGSLLWQHDTYVDTLSGGAVADVNSDGSVDFVFGISQWDYAGIKAFDLGGSGSRLYWQSKGGMSDTRTGCLSDIDPDLDGLSSVYEVQIGTNETDWDSDSDLMSDGYEICNGLNNAIDDSSGDGDSDNLSNLEEYQAGTYPDTADSDFDGMSDDYEFLWGLNPGYDDSAEDPDADLLNNLAEFGASTDPFNNDTDSDTMPDGYEVLNGINPLVDDRTDDPDTDDLTNIEEFSLGTHPNDADSENDGMPDGWEHNNGLNPLGDDSGLDPDNDTLDNLGEFLNDCDPHNNDTDSDTIPDGWEVDNGINPLLDDSANDPDSDSLTNLQEYQHDTNPLEEDSDFDDLDDYEEIFTYGTDPNSDDSDSDDMHDGWEVLYNLDPLDDSDASEDPDSDNLTNLQEHNIGTNPLVADTDSDGINDGDEVDQGLDPLVPNAGIDSDQDGLDDAVEITLGTDPLEPDSDADGLLDGWEVSRGLDPLQYTTYTGEGIERVVIAVAVCGGIGALGWVAVMKGAEKASILRRLKKRHLYVPGVIFLSFALMFAMFDVHGPVDPGWNSLESTSELFNFHVFDGPYFGNDVRITVWYEMRYIEVCSVTLTFTQVGEVTRTENLEIESTSLEVKNEYDYGSVILAPGGWQVTVSSSLSRYIHIKLEQDHNDGRNEDQVIWFTARIYFVGTGILLIVLARTFHKRKP